MNPADLQRIAHRELRRLPAPRAPHTLLPRVMAAVQEWSLRPWYARDWFTWPEALKVASAIALVLLVFGSALLWPRLEAAFTPVVVPATVLWRMLLEPLVPYAFVFVMSMCLACAAFAAALNQVVRGAGLSGPREAL
jgi:predicted permease